MRGTPMLDEVGLPNLPRPSKQEWLSSAPGLPLGQELLSGAFKIGLVLVRVMRERQLDFSIWPPRFRCFACLIGAEKHP
jgi:hypothetical protein